VVKKEGLLGSKRGQAEISYFIMILAVILIAFVIMLPSSEKEAVFGDLGPIDSITPGGSSGTGFKNVLSESPGLMTPFHQEIIQRPLASVNLFAVESQDIEALATNLKLESSIFIEDEKEFIFKINDPENLEEVKLLFFLVENDGEFTVEVNGFEIFNGELTSEMIPIVIPKSYLKKNNRIVLRVERPAFYNFMFTDTYVLKDVSLVMNYMIENKYEQRHFVLSESELKNLNKITLYYLLNCQTINQNTNILIRLNSKPVHDALLVCDAGVTGIDFNIGDLVEGRNVLEFNIDKGSYVLEQVLIEGDVAKEDFEKYYFTLQVADINALIHGAYATLEMKFLNDGFRKAGAIYVNGFPVYFDVAGADFVVDIDGLVYEGENTLVIVPNTAFEMLALNVFLS